MQVADSLRSNAVPVYVTTHRCNGRFFGPRACGLGRVSVGRHAFAGLQNLHATEPTEVETAPTMVSTGRLTITVGGTGAVRVSVKGDKGRGFEQCIPIRNKTEAEVIWHGGQSPPPTKGGGSVQEYEGGALALVFQLEPGAVLWAYHL